MSNSPLLFRTVIALFCFQLPDVDYPRIIKHVSIKEETVGDVVELLLIA